MLRTASLFLLPLLPQFLGASVMSREVPTVSVVTSVRLPVALSTRIFQLLSHWTDYHEI